MMRFIPLLFGTKQCILCVSAMISLLRCSSSYDNCYKNNENNNDNENIATSAEGQFPQKFGKN